MLDNYTIGKLTDLLDLKKVGDWALNKAVEALIDIDPLDDFETGYCEAMVQTAAKCHGCDADKIRCMVVREAKAIMSGR